jgi:VWFA-related protein
MPGSRFAIGLFVLCLTPSQNPLQTPVQTPQTPVFRAGTTLVPVDVRVIDRAGKPITDLRQTDFLLIEDNVRQEIRHFSTQSLQAQPPVAGAKPLFRSADATVPLGSQTNRIFLIVLGRGRLQPPAKGVDGVIHLVKERLLPQDHVAVLAWNRATDFTTDHTQILQVLERFKKQHEGIEADLAMRFSGLAAIYGGSEIPKAIQTKIDAVFGGPLAAGTRTVTDPAIAGSARMADDQRRANDALQRAEILANRTGTSMTEAVDPVAAMGLDGMSLDDLTSITAQSMQDLSKLYTGIQYLRYLEGEKHLLFVSPSGVFLPRTEDDRNLASLAADARIAISIVHTGGMAGPAMPGGGARGGGGGGRGIPMNVDWRGMTSRTVAEETGGTYSSLSYASAFVDRLDDATRFQYVLGYYPTKAELDGKFRKINVRVLNRPGATVLFRHGYFANTQLTQPLDRRRMMTYSRVTGAAGTSQPVPDIKLTVTATNAPAGAMPREVQVQIKIAPERLSFADKNGKKVGSIEIAIFCADGRERLVGQSWNIAELEMTPEAFERFKVNGLSYGTRVPVSADAAFVKAVVYDYGADVIGSMMFKITTK